MPLTVPVKFGDSNGANNAAFPCSLANAERIESPSVRVPVLDANPVRNLPVTIWLAIEVELWEPLTSPESSPVKLAASTACSAAKAFSA